MDSLWLSYVFYFLLKYDQILEAQRKAGGFDGMLKKMGHNVEVNVFQIKFWVKTLKKHIEKQYLKEMPWSINPHTS